MNNTIEFVVRMKNLMGGELGKLSSTAQSSFGKMAKHVDQVSTRNKILNMSFSELSKRISETENTIRTSTIPSQIAFARRELAALQKQSNSHQGNIGGGMGKGSSSGIGIGGVAVGGMLANAGSKLFGIVTDGIGGIVEKTFSKERAVAGLTTFIGKEGANDAYSNIRKDARDTTFETESLLEVNRALISSGLNAKQARVDTMNLANAVTAVGAGDDVLSRMAANMQQIKTVGKATAMDIRQFGIAGINIYEMLSKSTGKNINQVKEMDVTYEQLSKALAMSAGKGGIYEGALAAQANTNSGKWDIIKGSFGDAAVDIGVALTPIFTKILTMASKISDSIGPALQMASPYIDYFANGLTSILDSITQITSGTSGWSDYLEIGKNYVSQIWMFIKDTGIQLWNLVASIFQFVKNSEILKDIFRFVGVILENVFYLVKIILSDIQWLWDSIISPILNAIDKAYKMAKEFLGFGDKEISVNTTKKLVGMPKQDKDSALFQNSKLKASNESAGKSAGETVTGGGPKVINISVGKFFDNIQFATMDGKESASELEKVVMECLGRVVLNGAKLV